MKVFDCQIHVHETSNHKFKAELKCRYAGASTQVIHDASIETAEFFTERDAIETAINYLKGRLYNFSAELKYASQGRITPTTQGQLDSALGCTAPDVESLKSWN